MSVEKHERMTDEDVAKAYAKAARDQLQTLCDMINQARGVDSMAINFGVGPGSDGRVAITSLTVEKITKLVG